MLTFLILQGVIQFNFNYRSVFVITSSPKKASWRISRCRTRSSLPNPSSLQHHIPCKQHHIPRFNIIFLASTSYSSLATTPPPPQLPTPSNGTHNQRAPCGDIPRGMDGDAARFPAKTKPWFVIGESFPPKTTEEEEEGFSMVGCRENKNSRVFTGCKK